MLVALKKRLAPTEYARKLEITRRYLVLKAFSKTEEVVKEIGDRVYRRLKNRYTRGIS